MSECITALSERLHADVPRYIQVQNGLIENGELEGAHHIDLEAVLIGNGWYDPLLQYEAYYNFSLDNTYDIGLPNGRVKNQMYNAMFGPGNCYDMTEMCRKGGRNDVCSMADNFCYENVEYVWDVSTGRDEYDIRELSPDPFPPSYYVDYLNTPKVQQAIGAFVNFTDNNIVNTAFSNTGDDDRLQGAVRDSKKLVEQGIYMVQFNGDAGK
jgi:carboxypeptidase C (cathepsin A)